MENNQNLYTFSNIQRLDLNDSEVLSLLKREWSYNDRHLFVYGQITNIETENSDFWVIDNFYHIKTMERLLYPVPYEENIKQTIYIDKRSYVKKSKLKNKQWVKARLELSPFKEREKHNNPFELIAIEISELTEIPLPEEIEVLGSAQTKLIEKQWHDLLYQKANSSIEKEIEIKRLKVSQLDDKITQNQNTFTNIAKQIKDLNDKKLIKKQEFQKLQKEIKDSIQKIQQKNRI